MSNPLSQIVKRHREGEGVGIYSVCSANRYVLEASMYQAMEDNTILLIESTSNQVNQSGGYADLTPSQFVKYVREIARSVDFHFEKIVFGGDHLGPNPWQGEKADEAMAKARDMVREYILAGYRKIHLDASMRCADDAGNIQEPLNEEIVARRTADLCRTAEDAFAKNHTQPLPPYYVIGTDVPIPGGEFRNLFHIRITETNELIRTIELTRKAFLAQGLQSAWERVIAIVVHPGVDFADEFVLDYSHDKVTHLSNYIKNYPNLVYEAHSTDYQTANALRQMVKDHFTILKVGPWLTFAFREAVFSLAEMEQELLAKKKAASLSEIKQVLDEAMCENPEYWQKYYRGDENDRAFARKYSFSDRSRYYWNIPSVKNALTKLIRNLTYSGIPLTLLSQYMPAQCQAVRNGRIENKPAELIRDKIMQVTKIYAFACGYNTLA